MTESSILLWTVQHHRPYVSTCAEIEDAVGMALAGLDSGTGAPDCIELPQEGRTISGAALNQMVNALRERRWVAEQAREETKRAIVMVAHPNGRGWTSVEARSSLDEAEAAASGWRSIVGPDRVKVEGP